MAKMRRKFRHREKSEFDQKLVDLARVARIVAGGRRMSFRALLVIGNRKGKVGMGLAKGSDVSQAIEKAVFQAKKKLIEVKITKSGTIPHEVQVKKGSAKVFLKPAFPGTGIIAGGPLRPVLELAGIKDVFGKIHGAKNKINNVAATLKALEKLQTKEEIFLNRGKKLPAPKEKVTS